MLELHSGNVEHPFKSSFVQGQSDVDIATNVQPTKTESRIDKVKGLICLKYWRQLVTYSHYVESNLPLEE